MPKYACRIGEAKRHDHDRYPTLLTIVVVDLYGAKQRRHLDLPVIQASRSAIEPNADERYLWVISRPSSLAILMA